jgi:uncharacterized protein
MSSTLLPKIMDAIKTAMKAQDKLTLETLRTLHSDIKNISINSGNEITDEIVIDVLAKSVKQLNDANEQFRAGNRLDLVAANDAKIAVYQSYLPQALTEAELTALIAEVKERVGAVGPKDMGKIMKEVTPLTKGRADAKLVSSLVQASLQT